MKEFKIRTGHLEIIGMTLLWEAGLYGGVKRKEAVLEGQKGVYGQEIVRLYREIAKALIEEPDAIFEIVAGREDSVCSICPRDNCPTPGSDLRGILEHWERRGIVPGQRLTSGDLASRFAEFSGHKEKIVRIVKYELQELVRESS